MVSEVRDDDQISEMLGRSAYLELMVYLGRQHSDRLDELAGINEEGEGA